MFGQAQATEQTCWRAYYRGRGCPYRLLLGFLDAPDESSARVRAWHLWGGLEPVRLCVERAGWPTARGRRRPGSRSSVSPG